MCLQIKKSQRLTFRKEYRFQEVSWVQLGKNPVLKHARYADTIEWLLHAVYRVFH